MPHPARPARHLVIACLGLGLVLALGFAVLVGLAGGRIAAGPVTSATPYTVAEVQAGLTHDRRVWSGRTILVRADIVGMGWSRNAGRWGETLDLSDETAPGAPTLRVAFGMEDPLLAVLRRLPVVKELVPPPQDMQPPGGIYRIHLLDQATCSASPCHNPQPSSVRAVLLDAPPVHSPL